MNGMNNPSVHWRKWINYFGFVLALDPFQISTNENNFLNLTEGNIAVITCELPKGNPKPIPVFSLDNNRIEIESNSSRRKSLFRKKWERDDDFCLLDRYKVLPSGNLHIIDVKQSDSGKYQCSAKNPLTGDMVNNSQVTILQVSNKPSDSRERQPIFTVYKPPVASR